MAFSGDRGVLAYSSGDHLEIAFSRSLPSFGKPVEISGPGHLASGMHRGPRVAIGPKEIVVSAIYGSSQARGEAGDLLAWNSTDDGNTWAGPFRVSDQANAAREGLHAMAMGTDGRLACAWLDLRNKGTQVWASTSTDGGRTWSPNVQVYRSPDGHVCECCHPSVAFGPKGELYVMFRNWLGGNRDMYVSKSEDGGRTFEGAAKLGNGSWPLNACPMDGGSLLVDRAGKVTTAWRRDTAVYSCVLGQPEQKIGDGVQICATFGPGGLYPVWQHGDGIAISTPGTPPVDIASEGIRPSVASNGRYVIAAWADHSGNIWLDDLTPKTGRHTR